MKRIIIIIAIVLVPFGLSAQSRDFRKFYDKYEGQSGYTTMEMSGSMFGAMNGSDAKGGANISNQIDKIMIVIAESAADHKEFRNELSDMVSDGEYDNVMSVMNNGQSVKMYTLKNSKGKTEFLTTVLGTGESVVMLIVGDDLTVEEVTNWQMGD